MDLAEDQKIGKLDEAMSLRCEGKLSAPSLIIKTMFTAQKLDTKKSELFLLKERALGYRK